MEHWRTGAFLSSKNSHLNKELSINEGSEVIGYLYVGSPDIKGKDIPSLNKDDYVKYWD